MEKDGKAGRYYKGSVAKTISGKKCQKWSEQKPYKHKYAFVGDHNFCRNPKNGHTGVWCYTTSRKKRWEDCAVPKCKLGAAISLKNCEIGVDLGFDYAILEVQGALRAPTSSLRPFKPP